MTEVDEGLKQFPAVVAGPRRQTNQEGAAVDEFVRVRDAEVQALPGWARVAFTARCVRRVQPLLRTLEGPGADRLRDAIEQAVRLAEQSAAAGVAQDGLLDAALAAEAYGDQAGPQEGQADPDFDPVPQDVALAAAATARAAADCTSADAVTLAVANAQEAADEADAPEFAAAMRQDFERLRRAATEGAWSDTTPVPADFFGPLT